MKRPQPPQFFADVYRDLRDRRLLIPIAALVVALVAVPLLLSEDPEPVPPPAPPASIATEEAAAVQPAVLVEEVGIRDYRKRLAALKRKNPFEQKFVLPEASAEGGPTPIESPSPVDSTTPSPPTDTATSSGTGGSTSTAPVSPTDTGPAPTIDETTINDTTINETTIEQPKPEIRFYAGRVDIVIGPLGETKKLDDVRYLDFLPNDRSPVVAFLGLREAAEKAVFSVSLDVVETKGDGSCAPKKPDPCQFLTLGVGEQRMLKLANGKTFRLKLKDTHVVRVPDPREGDSKPGDGSKRADG